MPFRWHFGRFSQAIINHIAALAALDRLFAVFEVAIPVRVGSNQIASALDIEPAAGADAIPPSKQFEKIERTGSSI